MRRCALALLLAAAFGTPASAQDDFPRVDVAFGYGSLRLPDTTCCPGYHSGIAFHTGLNLTRWFGVENFLGYYSLPPNRFLPEAGRRSVFVDTVGARFAARDLGRWVPDGVAGVGLGYSREVFSRAVAIELRLGGGVDFWLNEGVGLRFDAGRLSLKPGTWLHTVQFSTGVVFSMD